MTVNHRKISRLERLLVVAFSIIAFFPALLEGFRNISSDGPFNAPDLIRFDGYPMEIHHVETEDGYILELHRIPFGKNDISSEGQRPVAFFAHCYFCSSSSYIALDPEDSIAYTLANNGYDVWLVNSRGNPYSKNHAFLSSKSKQFWQFSWHEQGYYDMPASIDYVLHLTGEKKLDFIGFSMGSTQFFVLMSERPEYNNKIRNMISLAPSVFIKGSQGTLPVKFPISQGLERFGGSENGNHEIPHPDFDAKEILWRICSLNIGTPRNLCSTALKTAGGSPLNGNIDLNSFPFFLRFFPESTSIMNIVHYTQIIKSGKFQKFDYGKTDNLLRYGRSTPPSYNLSRVTAPVHVFWAEKDTITPMEGIKFLISKLPNVVFSHKVQFEDFAHIDFIWGSNAKSVVYDIVLPKLLESLPARDGF